MWFRRQRFDDDLREEMRAHLREREAAYVRDGLASDEAARRAALAFGNTSLIHEQSRDVWLLRWLEHIRRDVRIAVRMLRGAPGFAAAAIATLALGVGANVAMFTLIDALLLRPLPYASPDRLVRIAPGFLKGAVLVLRDQGRHFDRVGGYTRETEVTWTGGPEPARLNASLVTGDLFSVLGIPAAQGRAIEMRDEMKGAERVAVIGHGFWQRHLGGRPDAIGRAIVINGEPLRIAGIMPASFRFPSATIDLWIPSTIDPSDPLALWAVTGMEFVARLSIGSTPESAQADVPRLAGLLRDAHPWPMPREFGLSTVIVPLQQSTMAGVRDGFVMLIGAVSLVLMVACANVATLLLARSESRARELAVRGALGAGRSRLALQLFLESAILAALGAAAGVALLAAALPSLASLLPADVPRVRDFAIDLRVLAFAGGAALATTMLIGVLPALRAARPDLTVALGTGDVRSGRRTRAFGALVAAEVALALVLVASAGLLLRSLTRLTAVDPGFDPRGLVSARIHPIESRYESPAAREAFYRDLVERVSALPGIAGAAAVSHLPLDAAAGWWALSIESHPVAEGAPAWTADERSVTPDYFDVMRVPLRDGRVFDGRDSATAPLVVVINESMARRYWPGKSAVGQRIKPVWQPGWRTIVGVVADVRNRSLADAPADEFYLPAAQNPVASMTLVARGALEAGQTIGAIRTAVAEVDAQAAVSEAGPVDAAIRETVAERGFVLRVLGAFAALALALGAIGIYGVTAYGVARRGREIGLRLALGATRRGVIGQLLLQIGRPVAAGLVMGVAGALAGGQILSGMLYRASPADPAILAAGAGLLALTAIAAAFIPAFRATRLDPAAALRQD
jgi:predicted permease